MKNVVKKISNIYNTQGVVLSVFSIYIFATIFDLSMGKFEYPVADIAMHVIRYACYLVFTVKALSNSYKLYTEHKNAHLDIAVWIKECKLFFAICVCLFVTLVANFIITGNKQLLILSVVLLAFMDVDFKELVKCTLYVQCIGIVVVVSLCTFQILPDFIHYRGHIVRHSMGFIYPKDFAQFIMFGILLYGYLKKFSTSLLTCLILQGINTTIYFLSDSRMEFIVGTMVLLITAINTLTGKNLITVVCEKIGKSVNLIFPAVYMLNIICVLGYGHGEFFEKINRMLSNRLSQSSNALENYRISLFGQKTNFVGLGYTDDIEELRFLEQNGTNFVDDNYLQILLTYGAIIFACIILCLTVCIYVANKQKDYNLLFALITTSVFCIISPCLLRLCYNPMLFAVIPSVMFFKKQIEQKNGQKNHKKLHIQP